MPFKIRSIRPEADKAVQNNLLYISRQQLCFTVILNLISTDNNAKVQAIQ